MKHILRTLFACVLVFNARAQGTFPVNGIKPNYNGHYAYTNANVYVTHDRLVTKATLLVKENKVVAVGSDVKIPADALVTDMKGEYIYPAFIDLHSNYGINAPAADQPNGPRPPQFVSDKKGPYNWNQAVKPETNAVEFFNADSAKAETLRAMGFGYTLSHAHDGIVRGTGALVTTANNRGNKTVISPQAATFYSFRKGSSTQDFPASLMGSIALLRQTFYDARWYANGGAAEEQNLSLDALNKTQSLPKIFLVDDVQSALRADAIAKEFDASFILAGNNDEYQRVNELKLTKATFVLPLNFSKPYDIASLGDAAYASLAHLKHWELAPFNARILHEHGIPFCFTSTGSESAKDFLANVRLTVKNGLPKSEALKALTTVPAKLIGMEAQVGSLEVGRRAAFVVTTGDLFSDTSKIVNVHLGDRDYIVSQNPVQQIAPGEYKLSVSNIGPFDLVIDDNPVERKPFIRWNNTAKVPVNIAYDYPFVKFDFTAPSGERYRLSGYADSTGVIGNSFLPNGTNAPWRASFYKSYTRNDTTKKKQDTIPAIPQLLFPFQAYGWDTLPQTEDVLFKNATVWTNEKAGIMQNADVWIRDGKIFKVGNNLSGAAKTIDATGKHLTSGVIDEHSHIAIHQGVNEGTQSVTSEVRIGDVINANDVNIYRQLAGGVTCSHLLHGSANCIGGQSQLIKLRWGRDAEGLKFKDWPGFIKFALGENVKQSHWGDFQTVRFPQTRMGVEQVFYDAFMRAKHYKKAWNDYNTTASKKNKTSALVTPRRDLELDALVEILDKKRFITCHSYVQSEINMLMKVADSMGFTVNTFTHILEGYKVADKMKAHNANASTFSDWWAYKYEVIDAIPHNGAILHAMGLNTSFNSDDAEMARRLNQEAAKAVKYGGVSEEDAWKFVTLNPAKMLHVDDKVGSIKEGKDADVVLWSDNPLSIYAKAERTYVDGICYYSLEDDQRKREFIRKEKARLLSLMQDAKKNGAQTQPYEQQQAVHYHCDTDGEFVK